MAITVNADNLTPLEQAAIEQQKALAGESVAELTDGEFLSLFLARIVETWKEGVIDDRLASLRPLARRWLNLDAEEQAEILERLDELDPPTVSLEGEQNVEGGPQSAAPPS